MSIAVIILLVALVFAILGIANVAGKAVLWFGISLLTVIVGMLLPVISA